MSNQLKIVVGQDYAAYAEINVPIGTDLSDENLADIANTAIEDWVFDVDYSTGSSLRIVSVHDQTGKIIKSDIPIDASTYDSGMALQTFLSGQSNLADLVQSAADAKLIDPIDEVVIYAGHLKYPGGLVAVDFQARKDATQAELDLAFLQGLAQICTIGYLAVGEKAVTA